MNELDAFSESTLPWLEAAETALHNGDAAFGSPCGSGTLVTLSGAARNATGRGRRKVVHRHGDPFDAAAGQLASRVQGTGTA